MQNYVKNFNDWLYAHRDVTDKEIVKYCELLLLEIENELKLSAGNVLLKLLEYRAIIRAEVAQRIKWTRRSDRPIRMFTSALQDAEQSESPETSIRVAIIYARYLGGYRNNDGAIEILQNAIIHTIKTDKIKEHQDIFDRIAFMLFYSGRYDSCILMYDWILSIGPITLNQLILRAKALLKNGQSYKLEEESSLAESAVITDIARSLAANHTLGRLSDAFNCAAVGASLSTSQEAVFWRQQFMNFQKHPEYFS